MEIRSGLGEVFKDEKILDPRYIPDLLQCRDDEINKLNFQIVKRVNSNIVPKHLMVVGPTGSGKTVCTKHVVNAIKDSNKVVYSSLLADSQYIKSSKPSHQTSG